MAWFRRSKESISSDSQKKDTPEGLWTKCESCGEIVHKKALEQNLWVCAKCNFHFRIGSKEYFAILLDAGSFSEMDRKMTSKDPLNFSDTKRYKDRIRDSIKKSGLNDAVRSGTGKINKHNVVIACMDFAFIGGSMGSVVGEKIMRAMLVAAEKKVPLIVFTSSGGARMQEGILSLMQMAKTAVATQALEKARCPYFVVLTDPTTAGVLASFAMLGDVTIAEPGALMRFAGARVVAGTIREKVPDNFPLSEYHEERGFIDLVVPRQELKKRLGFLLKTHLVPTGGKA